MVWPFSSDSKNQKEKSSFEPDSITAPDVSSILGGGNNTELNSNNNNNNNNNNENSQQTGVSGVDFSKLHPLAGLDKGLEFLDLEDETLSTLPGSKSFLPSRGFTDDLCYGTGAVYLTGLGLGGAYGLAEGLRNCPADISGRLRLNTVLNSITRRGPFVGNTAGVLAMSYNIIDGALDTYRGKHDDWNSLAAGAISGAIFRSTKGLKQMFIASALMTSIAGAWCTFKNLALG